MLWFLDKMKELAEKLSEVEAKKEEILFDLSHRREQGAIEGKSIHARPSPDYWTGFCVGLGNRY